MHGSVGEIVSEVYILDCSDLRIYMTSILFLVHPVIAASNECAWCTLHRQVFVCTVWILGPSCLYLSNTFRYLAKVMHPSIIALCLLS